MNKAEWRVVTTPKAEQTTSIDVLKARTRDVLRKIALPDTKIVVTDPLFVEGTAVEAPIVLNVCGDYYEDIVPLSNQVQKILQETHGVDDIQIKYSPERSKPQVQLDRARVFASVGQITILGAKGSIKLVDVIKLN
ncbi:hypothetical protein [Pajaroellobacter abortibovis]|uniref:Uncharacterized protein n=1 Tax=Pajaroellobacter abortibovis TaxID=1882918 RepID=A0A1L6MV01_9BACT|nr:hypothetical protein [Pajaroellobacter abortibovis]APR99342.1 hypothetical protein BCY86_00605 [Pajaroellobacter abortibovis]